MLCVSINFQVMFTMMVPNFIEIKDEDNIERYRYCSNITNTSPNIDKPGECLATFYYKNMYASVLGLDTWAFDVREDDLELNIRILSEVLFGIFSFFTIVLLLNFLIAVISDSYEKHLLQSNKLFGRARIRFLADTIAFQNLFVNLKDPKQERWTRGGYAFLVGSLILYAIFVGFEYINIKQNKVWMFVSFGVNAWLVISANIILSQQVGLMAGKQHARGLFMSIFLGPISILQWIITLIQGPSVSFIDDSKNGPDDWRGRVHYLKREIDRIGNENNCKIDKLRLEMSQMKQRENDAMERVENEMKDVKNQMKEILELLKRKSD